MLFQTWTCLVQVWSYTCSVEHQWKTWFCRFQVKSKVVSNDHLEMQCHDHLEMQIEGKTWGYDHDCFRSDHVRSDLNLSGSGMIKPNPGVLQVWLKIWLFPKLSCLLNVWVKHEQEKRDRYQDWYRYGICLYVFLMLRFVFNYKFQYGLFYVCAIFSKNSEEMTV